MMVMMLVTWAKSHNVLNLIIVGINFIYVVILLINEFSCKE